MDKNVIVRLDKIEATQVIENVYFEEDQQVGITAQLGELSPDGEGRKGLAPTALDRNLVFMAPVVLGYEDNMMESEFVMKAGKLHRGYVMIEGNIITMTDNAFDAKPEVGDVIIPKTGEFGYEKATDGTRAIKESSLAFEVIGDSEYLEGEKATLLRVI